MIKKLVSNALLSMVMDKKARKKLNAVQEQKRRQQGGASADAESARPERAATKPAASATMAKADRAAGAEPRAPRPARTAPPSIDEDDPEALIREALEEAELELIQKRNRKPMTSERQALIDQAMAIHKSKSHVLDDLDSEHREKLTFMALKALDKNFGE